MFQFLYRLVIFVGMWHTSRAFPSLRTTNLHIRECSVETCFQQNPQLNIWLSVVITCGTSIFNGFNLQSLKTGLQFDIIANFTEQVDKRVTEIVVTDARIFHFCAMKWLRYIKKVLRNQKVKTQLKLLNLFSRLCWTKVLVYRHCSMFINLSLN